jgi:hypothetical protein
MKSSSVIKTLAVATILLILSTAAHAQATHTWVSGVGDDANSCSRKEPCRNFAGALAKTADGGVISVLDPGGFGGVTITKSVTIENEGNLADVLASSIVINAEADDIVVLRGITIAGVGKATHGISFLNGLALFVENCQINRVTEQGINFQPSSGASFLFVKDTTIHNNNFPTGGGIRIKPAAGASAEASLDRVRIERNLVGLKVEDRANVTIRDSVIARNTNEGLFVDSEAEAAELNVESSMITHNGVAGIRSEGGKAIVRMARTSLFNNKSGLVSAGGDILSFGNNHNADSGAPTGTIAVQ